ncbi:hypothetical protein HMP09_0278 [Sphingomonas sp. HMP9]|uniref:hypothetical protein n=1 Tax=Sphingomonas sp. HMP9 TaxID=1517554 RepID=UPI0015965323|nr:hypothetical protein [Sphingomonas sp. HMP9]BCA61044.1 hypothetical protein HMP09_0278 [Sphingomonas sp. HMP9]
MVNQNETTPIAVNASPVPDQAASALRSVVLVASVITALPTIASKRDLAGFIVYVQSSEFLQAVSIIVSIATFAWGQWKIRRRAKQLAAVGANPRVPNDIISIKPTA